MWRKDVFLTSLASNCDWKVNKKKEKKGKINLDDLVCFCYVLDIYVKNNVDFKFTCI